jgi:hypothetical protein
MTIKGMPASARENSWLLRSRKPSSACAYMRCTGALPVISYVRPDV